MTFANAGLEMDEAEQTMMNNEDEQNCSDQPIVQRTTQDEYVVSEDWPNANNVGTKKARKSETTTTTTRRTSVKLTAGQKALEVVARVN